MQQGTFTDEDQRRLNHDDVATALYGMAGLDEIAGTPDDYTLGLSYAGLTTVNISGVVLFGTGSGFGQGSTNYNFVVRQLPT